MTTLYMVAGKCNQKNFQLGEIIGDSFSNFST